MMDFSQRPAPALILNPATGQPTAAPTPAGGHSKSHALAIAIAAVLVALVLILIGLVYRSRQTSSRLRP